MKNKESGSKQLFFREILHYWVFGIHHSLFKNGEPNTYRDSGINYLPRISLIFLAIILIQGCGFDAPLPGEKQEIIFLGHIYQKRNRFDRRLEKVNYNRYDQIWLGGDLCSETTEEKSTLNYLNKHFRLDDPGTHWAPGNHDTRNGNTDWITEYTERELFYVHSDQGLTIMVLNTTFDTTECQLSAMQDAMITTLLDTIEKSSHLVILSHHTIWGDAITGINMWETANANKPQWESLCGTGTRFIPYLEPRLRQVQDRGVQVICLAGDFGQQATSFEYLSDGGIWYLGAGLNKGKSQEIDPDDMVIVFHFDPVAGSLNWDFIRVDNL